jgi:hypothetical protein
MILHGHLAQKNSNFIHGLEWLDRAILAIFQKLADWLDWPCPVCAALKNCLLIFFFSFYFFFIVRSSASCFGDLDLDPSSVLRLRPNFP